MKIFEIIDYLQRMINSFLFRGVLISYLVAILLIEENMFSPLFYIGAFVLYIAFYIFTSKHHTVRLINDFLIISIIILGKDPSISYIFICILLPIINSINFTGRSVTYILYLLTSLSYLGLLLYFNKNSHFVYSDLSPLICLPFLCIIEIYTYRRVEIRNFIENLNEVIDGFYSNKEFFKKPHKIYPELILNINDKFQKLTVSNIYCFTILPENNSILSIVNSSEFVWNYELDNEEIINTLKKRDYAIDYPIVIDGMTFPYNCILKTEIDSTVYIFILVTNKTIPFYYKLIGFFRILIPTFNRIAKILFSERQLRDIRTEELNVLSQRRQYVTRATKMMHHIRNRLGPINNLIKMLDTRKDIDEKSVLEFDKLLDVERNRAKNELDNIIERANYLLEKNNNPFNFIETKNVSIKGCFSILMRNLNIYFPNEANNIIKIQIENAFENLYVSINDEGFELFLSDWLNNVKKYNNSKVQVVFILNNDSLIVEFWNNYNCKEEDIDSLISDLMSTERNEIMKRTTHGLYQIKTCLEEMGIKYKIVKIRDIIKFEIILKVIYDEDSNI